MEKLKIFRFFEKIKRLVMGKRTEKGETAEGLGAKGGPRRLGRNKSTMDR